MKEDKKTNRRRPNNSITLQINSLEVLERLIGDDSNIEIDIRNSIVQKFAEKHLKCLAIKIEDEYESKLRKDIESHFDACYYLGILDKRVEQVNKGLEEKCFNLDNIVEKKVAEILKKKFE